MVRTDLTAVFRLVLCASSHCCRVQDAAELEYEHQRGQPDALRMSPRHLELKAAFVSFAGDRPSSQPYATLCVADHIARRGIRAGGWDGRVGGLGRGPA